MNAFARILALTTLTIALAGRSDVITDWNSVAMDDIRALNTPPPLASRNLAILHLAIYDAVNGITRTHESYHVRGNVPASASKEAAASAAANKVLNTLYPSRQTQHGALHNSVLAGIHNGQQKTRGAQWGENVADAILALRSNDGSANTAPFPGSLEPGQWRPTESFGGVVRPALLPLWGSVTPFGITSGSQFRPPPPPALDTAAYAEEVNFVKLYGETNSAVRTADETQIAKFWAYGPTTATPPGHWNQIAQVVARSQRNSLAKNARMFALLNMAMADAAIVSWDCKYVYNLWRPITAIQLADTDDNPATEADPAWKPLLLTPPFPEYTSGHSTFSGAGAAVLAGFFRSDNIHFEVGSDDVPGTRRYESFSQAAEESGLSRIFGGIHFMSANVHGLASGATVGEHCLAYHLRPKRNRSGDSDDDDGGRDRDEDDGGEDHHD